MKSKGYISDKTWVDVYSLNNNKSGFVIGIKSFYSGPYKYLNRRIKDEK